MTTDSEKQLARVDINFEKWGIFTPTSKSVQPTREIIREIHLPDGGIQIQKVTIAGVVEKGQLRTLGCGEARVYYLACYLWEKQGRPKDGKINFSLLSFSKDLGTHTPGIKDYNRLKKEIRCCRSVPIYFENSYKTHNGEIINFETAITLFSDYKIFERRKDTKSDQPYFSFSSITLHPVIVKSLLSSNVKPIRFDVIKSLKHDVSILLWRHIDLVMFDKKKYERDLLELASELGLSTRQDFWQLKKTIGKALEELKGKDLTTGKIIDTVIEPSQTQSRWKVVVVKGKQVESKVESKVESDEPVKRVKSVMVKYINPQAREVKIAGSFSNWVPEEMAHFGGEWSVILELEPGEYEYKFIVDGQWICDPCCMEKVVDENGNENSVLRVGG